MRWAPAEGRGVFTWPGLSPPAYPSASGAPAPWPGASSPPPPAGTRRPGGPSAALGPLHPGLPLPWPRAQSLGPLSLSQLLPRELQAYKPESCILRPQDYPLPSPCESGLPQRPASFPWVSDHSDGSPSLPCLPILTPASHPPLTELGVPLASGAVFLRPVSRPRLTLSSRLFEGT